MNIIELKKPIAGRPRRRIGYSRVSSQEQSQDSNAHKQQTQRLIDAGVTEIVEEVLSGRKDDRPQLSAILKLVKNQEVDEIVAVRIDRLTRSLDKLQEIIQLCLDNGVNLVILDQNLNLLTPEGRLMVSLLGALAEWEVDLLSQRIRHGQNYRIQQRRAPGSCPFGFQVIEGHYLPDNRRFLCLLADRPNNYHQLSQQSDATVLPYRTRYQIAQEAIELTFAERRPGRTLAVLYEKYGVTKTSSKINGTDGILSWCRSSFRTWLKNPVLRGHTRYKRRIVVGKKGKVIKNPEGPTLARDTHPEHRLLTEEQFAEVEHILVSNQRIKTIIFAVPGDQITDYLPYSYQTGLVFCAECGTRCTSKRSGNSNRYSYYACRHAGVGCSNHKSVRKDVIEDALIRALVKRSTTIEQDPEPANDVSPQSVRRVEQLQSQLHSLEQVPGYLEGVEREKIQIQQQIDEILNPPPLNQLIDRSAREILAGGGNFADWYTLSNREKVEVYSKLVSKIYLRKGQVELVLLTV